MLTREKLLQIYSEYQDQIRNAVEAGEISSSEFHAYKEQGLAEFNTKLAELEGIDLDEYDEYDDMDEELSLNILGESLIALADEQGYEDLEDVILDLSDDLNVEPDDVLEMMVHPDVTEEDAYNFYVNTGVITEVDDEYDDEEEYEDDIDGEYDEYDEDEYDEEDNEASYRIQELEEQVAEFQVQSDLLGIINRHQARAEELMNEGNLPPFVYHKLFVNSSGDIPMNDEKVAQFSAAADAREVDIVTYLNGQEMILDMFEALNLSETGMFSALVDQYESNFEEEEAPDSNIDYGATLSGLMI